MTDKTVVLVSGKMRSGKNTFVDFAMDKLKELGIKTGYDFFAKDLKNYAKEDFKSIVGYLNSIADKYGIDELRTVDDNWYENKNIVTRILLQTYGTEIIRKRVSDSFWVERIMERLASSDNKVIFISDVRFPSEVFDVKNNKFGFKVIAIRVNRDDAVGEGVEHGTTEHPSETALDDYGEWDLIVNNNGTMDDLKSTAHQFSSMIHS